MNERHLFFIHDDDLPGQGGESYPLVDFLLTKDDVLILVEIPGVERDAINVKLDNQYVEIKGTRQEPDSFAQGTHFYKLESFYGLFKRRILMPVAVDVEKAKVVMKNGVLEIRIPRRKDQIIEIPVD